MNNTMDDIKYQYAYLDGDIGKIVHISNISQDNRNQNKYICIGCGHELLPRAIESKYRRPHFYHKTIVECSGETYLHKLAKQIIKEKFDNDLVFNIDYDVKHACEYIKQCPCRYPACEVSSSNQINLKDYYDTCEEEAQLQNYIADLLLSKSKDENFPKILIEIWVTYSCDSEKVSSGKRIIEIRIKNEQDIDQLRQIQVFRENYSPKKGLCITFYNFKKQVEDTSVNHTCRLRKDLFHNIKSI